jgi:hypothetical protein
MTGWIITGILLLGAAFCCTPLADMDIYELGRYIRRRGRREQDAPSGTREPPLATAAHARGPRPAAQPGRELDDVLRLS